MTTIAPTRPHRPATRKPHADASDPLAKLHVRRASLHGGYGWVHELPDARDYLYSAPLFRFPGGLPTAVDLRQECPPVYDQGQLGSCTANGIAGAIEFDQGKQGNKQFVPSRLFIYYNERAMEGTVNQDSGAQIRDGIKSVAKLGAPPETDWPYDIQKFAQKPPQQAYTDGLQDLVSSYARVPQVLQQMQGCLASGYPFVFGFTVYESFERSLRPVSCLCRHPTNRWLAAIASSPSDTTTASGSSSSATRGVRHGASKATA
jgi:C1A family cysteine protease